MDTKLVAWARAVKARRRGRGGPVLWVFSDRDRLPDPVPVLLSLPPDLCGLVLRPAPGMTAAQVRAIGRTCRARRVALSVAGPLGRVAGGGDRVHLPGGRRRLGRRLGGTASAHGMAELVRCRRAGVGLVFLSPAFATASHPDVRALGPIRWAALARRSAVPVLALGGVDGRSVRRLPARWCAGAGAIGAVQESGGTGRAAAKPS